MKVTPLRIFYNTYPPDKPRYYEECWQIDYDCPSGFSPQPEAWLYELVDLVDYWIECAEGEGE